jgi:hydroxyethylthiazole kinase-like uncharacterized protein yjeF
MPLPAEIYTVASVRKIDQAAIKNAEISGFTLMTRAAEAAMREIQLRFPNAMHWQVVCGSGNNGGDGFVLARLAGHQGIAVSVLAMSDPEKLQGDAATAYMDFAAEGGVVGLWEGAVDEDADLLVDALLGSGLERDVEGDYAGAVAAINEHPAAVCSLDLPSGLHGDSGRILGTAVKADLTVTFVGLKIGLFVGNGPLICGDIAFADLEIPASCKSMIPPELRRTDDETVARALPRRDPLAHKGDFGHVLLIGGGPGMPGAIQLCGEGALRAGAGRVSIATHPSHAAQIASARPELMCHGIEDADGLLELMQKVDTLAIGPGLGTGEWARAMFTAATGSKLPIVIDADGLNLLAKTEGRRGSWILTPHPGEAATLLDRSTANVQADRHQAVTDLRQLRGGVTVLKGAGTLVVHKERTPWLCGAGNPGMAAPGMGDVLTGVIAGLLAQGLPAESAAVVGVAVHAKAGDRAALGGERGMTASDLLAELRACVNPHNPLP